MPLIARQTNHRWLSRDSGLLSSDSGLALNARLGSPHIKDHWHRAQAKINPPSGHRKLACSSIEGITFLKTSNCKNLFMNHLASRKHCMKDVIGHWLWSVVELVVHSMNLMSQRKKYRKIAKKLFYSFFSFLVLRTHSRRQSAVHWLRSSGPKTTLQCWPHFSETRDLI